MPSKLRKAIAAVKDQTSISLAKVSSNSASNLDVAVLKATTHEEVPTEDRHINEILLLTSSNKFYAAACAQAIAKRISRTRNWIVAVKSLMIVLRIFQDGDPYFPKEVLIAMKRGAKILNLSSFRDDYNSSPWDYTAFVRTFALYLNERLECFLTGKLQRRMIIINEREPQPRRNRYNEHVRDMKPAMLLDRISHWQRLLDRAIGTRPTGVAKNNRLVQIALYSIVRETFDLYRDISDGLALILDSFFHLQYQSCVTAYQTCIKASKQYGELSEFYTMCKGIGVGRTSEYPSVQTISEELLETLQEFLKDQSSFPGRPPHSPQRPQMLLPGANSSTPGSSSRHESYEQSETSEPPESISERTSTEMGSELNHERTVSLLEDLLSVTDAGTASPCYSSIISFNQEQGVEQMRPQSPVEDFFSVPNSAGQSPVRDFMGSNTATTSPVHDFMSVNTAGTSPSISTEQRNSSALELSLFDDTFPPHHEENRRHSSALELALYNDTFQPRQEHDASVSGYGDDDGREGWELVLAQTANHISSTRASIDASSVGFEPSFLDNLYNQPSTSNDPSNYNNPFLSGANEMPPALTPPIPLAIPPAPNDFSTYPTFQATPTFCVQNPTETPTPWHVESDPFADIQTSQGSTNQQHHLQHEQQLWLQNQNKIIGKHIA